MSKTVSEEMLNAYLDNELDEKDNRFIEMQIKNNVELQRRIEQLQDIKIKVRASYASVSPPVHHAIRPCNKRSLIPSSLAASLILCFGLASGWYTHGYINTTTENFGQLLGIKLEQLNPQDDKIIIHLAKNDRALFDAALTKAEKLLSAFAALNQQGTVRVLANSYGMDLLREDKTPYQERISNLMLKYNNVEFVACENTIKRLKSSGKNIELLPGVKVHGPVINEIISGLQNGWTYI
ncbi:MAG: hypothetical protein KAI17_24020, partial [Thiotrichaceae bacterium]|nr:hypothetical protein [Thiotrichaceae bacterium]